MKTFWIVMRDKAETLVSKRHPTLEEAQLEAKRLCQREGVRFYVLSVVGCAEIEERPVAWRYAPADGVWEIKHPGELFPF